MASQRIQRREAYKAQARVLKALAHESRLLIVDRLAQGECCAGELTALVGSDQSTVSRHLAVLRAHGIVDDRRDGNFVRYHLVTRCVTSFLGCAAGVLEERKGPQRCQGNAWNAALSCHEQEPSR